MFFKKKIRWCKIFDSEAAACRMAATGKAATLNVGKKKICFVHTSKGFYAVDDKCPHNGASLSNGYCTEEGSIVCPVHRYHFDLVSGRAKSGLGDCVQTYPIEVREDGVFIGFTETVWNFF